MDPLEKSSSLAFIKTLLWGLVSPRCDLAVITSIFDTEIWWKKVIDFKQILTWPFTLLVSTPDRLKDTDKRTSQSCSWAVFYSRSHRSWYFWMVWILGVFWAAACGLLRTRIYSHTWKLIAAHPDSSLQPGSCWRRKQFGIHLKGTSAAPRCSWSKDASCYPWVPSHPCPTSVNVLRHYSTVRICIFLFSFITESLS